MRVYVMSGFKSSVVLLKMFYAVLNSISLHFIKRPSESGH